MKDGQESLLDETGRNNLAEKLVAAEMKEIQERERAEHAQNMYERKREDLNLVEERALHLEQKLEEVKYIC